MRLFESWIVGLEEWKGTSSFAINEKAPSSIKTLLLQWKGSFHTETAPSLIKVLLSFLEIVGEFY